MRAYIGIIPTALALFNGQEPCQNEEQCDDRMSFTNTGLEIIYGNDACCEASEFCAKYATQPLDAFCENLPSTIESISCENGYACNDIMCPAGTYGKDISTVSECLECKLGYYCPIGSTEPKLCPDGFTANVGASSLANCSACMGVYCKGGEVANCGIGFYCPMGSSVPTPCPLGTSTVTQNAFSEDQCQPLIDTCDVGEYGPDRTDCTICPIAHYCPEGAAVPLICSGGTYNPNEGSSFCITCPAGCSCDVGSAVPETCSIGTFSFTGQQQCRLCTPGSYCELEGTQNPSLCPSGSYCEEGAVMPVICPIGTYSLAGQQQCTMCPAGSYCELSGTESPIVCPPGYSCEAGSTAPKVCLPGTYSSGGAQECSSCPAGTYCKLEGTELPTLCPLGTYCPEGSVAAQFCPNGSVGDITGLTSIDGCILCPVGYYCISGIATSCPVGSYCPSGSDAAIVCPDGTITTEVGANECNVCPTGYYCILGLKRSCGTGFYCPAGSFKPIACPNGFITATGNSVSIIDCIDVTSCGEDEIWSSCGLVCEPTCTDRAPDCLPFCIPKCVCASGFIRNSQGNCISDNSCPFTINRGKWSDFSDWSDCSAPCGNGVSIRTRSCQSTFWACGGTNTDVRLCNTESCSPNLNLATPCSCGNNFWSCDSAECGADEKCQLSMGSELLGAVHRCLPRAVGTCTAWGDPHVITFDGATNDVYGVAEYILAQSNSDILPRFHVYMRTSKWGQVSVAESLAVDFVTRGNSDKHFRIESDRYGKYSIFESEVLVTTGQSDYNEDFTFTGVPGSVSFRTWFGLEIVHFGLTVSVTVPHVYNSQVEGICGDFNFQKMDDYRLRDGTILSYETGDNYVRTSSEYQCANSWIVGGVNGGEIVLGPAPGEIDFESMCDVNAVNSACDSLFAADFMIPCLVTVDVTSLIAQCKIDFCASTTDFTLYTIVQNFMDQCKAKSGDELAELFCTWPSQFNGVPDSLCPENSSLKCGQPCADMHTCATLNCPTAEAIISMCFCNDGFVLSDGICVPENTCSVGWSVWSACDVECGGGVHSRSRIDESGEIIYEQKVCNVQFCRPSTEGRNECLCREGGINSWNCDSPDCSADEQCQRIVYEDIRQYCMPRAVGECQAWGDPHITTFDGAVNDVYGIGNYTLMQVNRTLFGEENRDLVIVMETAAFGHVSAVERCFVTVTAPDHSYTITTDRYGGYAYSYTSETEFEDEEFVKSINLVRNGARISFHTYFGMEFVHNGYSVTIRLPQVYSGLLEGLCGDFDFVKKNDYRLRDGTILSYAESGYDRTDSEYICAQSWLIEGDAGPSPVEINDELESCEVLSECDTMFTAGWMAECNGYIDYGQFVDACRVDYCMSPSKETKIELIGRYIYECSKYSPIAYPVCEWKNELNLVTCETGQKWSGCSSECDVIRTCDNLTPTCSSAPLYNGCMCPDGMISDGEGGCRPTEECNALTEWSDWTMCTAKCGGGTSTRSRECHTGDCGVALESRRKCNIQICPIEIGGQTECGCSGDDWMCESDVCESGTLCQRAHLHSYDYMCLPSGLGECKAWGDPHVVTFDGATNDVYGIANYTFVQLNQTAVLEMARESELESSFDVTEFTVIMETAAFGHVSAVERMFVTVASRDYQFSIRTDRYGGVNYEFDASGKMTLDEFLAFINMEQHGLYISYRTWFGFEFVQNEYTAIVRLPTAFSQMVEGLCGDFNMFKQNDYRLRNGTVLEFADSGFDRTDSEFYCAQSWLIEGTAGPTPNEVRKELESCEVKVECDVMFKAEWMQECNDALDPSDFIASCKVDYCVNPTEETKANLISSYIYQCSKYNPVSYPVCQWKNELNLSECNEGLVWSGCLTECDRVRTCEDSAPGCSLQRFNSGCVCPEGTIRNKAGGCTDMTQCDITCPIGTYSTIFGCIICPAGYSCAEGAVSPKICPSGSFNSQLGQAQCRPCLSGTFCPYEGHWAPFICPLGMFCIEGSTEAEFCPSGTVGDKLGLSSVEECAICPPGYHCNPGSVLFCGFGFFCPAGSSKPTQCPALLITLTATAASENECIPQVVCVDPNEIWNACGSNCPATCTEQDPVCDQVCVPQCECKPGFVRDLTGFGMCTKVEECPGGWFAWSECSASCGGGISTRTKDCRMLLCEQQQKRCNIQLCPVEIDGQTECSCDNDAWVCEYEGCQVGHACQRSHLYSNEHFCLPAGLGECLAWGDPHVSTFDGASNDVYGIANYTFAELNQTRVHEMLDASGSNMNDLEEFTVVMETAAFGHVSAVERMFVTVRSRNYDFHVHTDRYGGVSYEFSTKENMSKLEFENLINLQHHGSEISYQTWFGLQFVHNGYTAIVRLPTAFSGILQGLCGDFDMIKQNDYRLNNGTVLEYADSGFDRTDSEYFCAQSWLIEGSAGPSPNEVREELGDCQVKVECEHIFRADWMAECNDVLDAIDFISSCKVDYCIDSTEETKTNLVSSYIYECSKYNPISYPVCQWKNELDISECDNNMIWSGCLSECDLLRTCENSTPICSLNRFTSGCTCPEGTIRSGDGTCTDIDKCENKCPLGTFSTIFGCTICPVAHACPEGAVVPIICSPGTFSSQPGQSKCNACPAGTFCPEEGHWGPFICPLGMFCPEGSHEALFCPAGTLGGEIGLTSEEDCTMCPPGFYCNSGDVSLCGLGFYCPQGSSQPNKCPSNLITMTPTAITEDECVQPGICLGQNESWQLCGTACQATCTDLYPICDTQCTPGCECDDGYVRDLTQWGACINKVACPGAWTEWSDCTASCGGGISWRTKQCDSFDCEEQERRCNIQLCPVVIDDSKKCTCDDDAWACEFNGCEDGHSCQRSNLYSTEHFCLPEGLSECLAYGDPHVKTFDGATNDVYGIANYTYVQLNETRVHQVANESGWDTGDLEHFSVVMETAPFGHVSAVERMFVTVRSRQYDFTIRTNRYGGVSYEFYVNRNMTDLEFARLINLQIHGSQISYKTWFGFEFVQNGYKAIVRLPVAFSGLTEGLCGDFNMLKQDDYRLRNGTVLEYADSGNHRTDSEFLCAQSWLIEGTPGPDPNDVRDELENCTVKKECDVMFRSAWMRDCNKVLDPVEIIKSCYIDYCISPIDETRYNLISTYIHECSKYNPTSYPVCEWQNELNLSVCRNDQVWSGCLTECDSLRTCTNLTPTCSDKKIHSGCVCRPGALPDDFGVCVDVGECKVECPIGHFSPDGALSAKECTSCPVGFMCLGGMLPPSACQKGTFSPEIGQSLCMDCPAGTFCPEAGTSIPSPCSKGRYCPSGSTEQMLCPKGTITFMTGSTEESECTTCPPGFYCNLSISAFCGFGFYCPPGSFEPTACPPGSQSLTEIAISVNDCIEIPVCNGSNELYNSCGSACERKCTNLSPTCIDVCVPRCECELGYVRDEVGECILEKDCPIVVSFGKWNNFGPWSECSASCGTGVKTRTRTCKSKRKPCEGSDTDARVCNTEACSIETLVAPSCQCENNFWSCDNDKCADNEKCQLTATTAGATHLCLPREHGQCKSWGDPHVITFDGAVNDVYGVAEYILSRSNSSGVNNLHAFSVHMQTSKLGDVSVTESLSVEFEDRKGTGTFRIESHQNGALEIFYKGRRLEERFLPSMNNEFEFSITAGATSYRTWFGLEIMQSGHTVTINVAAIYQSTVEGICGDYNMVKYDDYRLRDGTILEYTDSSDYVRSQSEYDCSVSWIVGGEDAGPPPGDLNFDCDRAAVRTTCEELFTADILKPCLNMVDTSLYISQCRIDLCVTGTAQTKFEVLQTYINECAAKFDGDLELFCIWPTALESIKEVSACPVNSHFGCGQMCADSHQCGSRHCPAFEKVQPGCFCDEEYALMDGHCVHWTQCETEWTAWTECDAQCGGGKQSRQRLKEGDMMLWEEKPCNVEPCPINPNELTRCMCTDSWLCANLECGVGQSCHLVDVADVDMRCVSNIIGECRAYGDPHINTFDGATNDVYGIGNYTYVQFNQTRLDGDSPVKEMTVVMETAAFSHVSAVERMFVTVVGYGYVYSVTTDRYGGVNYDYSFDNTVNNEGFESFINLRIKGDEIYMKTWFGLELRHKGYGVSIRLPFVFSDKVEGLCGNFDMEKQNDYQLRDGTVLPYVSGHGHQRSDSEYHCAQSWLIEGDAGPSPNDIINELEGCEYRAECEAMFTTNWMTACNDFIDYTRYVTACQVDYCLRPTEETRHNLIESYIAECARHAPFSYPVCEWKNELNISGCPARLHWSGCISNCDRNQTCENVDEKCDFYEFSAGCICPKGTVDDGVGGCKEVADCAVSDWSNWSECNKNCGVGVSTRERECRSQKCRHHLYEERKCNIHLCPIDIDEYTKCSCDGDKWWCDRNVCEGATTCQRVHIFETQFGNEYRCLPSGLGECHAWGDPHVATFDGASNDVYGIGNYTFVQLNRTAISDRMNNSDNAHWLELDLLLVVMETAATGKVSAVERMHVAVASPDISFNFTTDKYGKFSYNFEGMINQSEFEQFVDLKQHGAEISYSTWFGMEFIQNGVSAKIRFPAAFSGLLEGVCGDFNMVKQNDYRLRNGTVLEYKPSGFDRTDSEYICAQSWLIEGHAGPNPNDIRDELESCEVRAECDAMFADAWINDCRQLLDPAVYITACKVDYCIDPSEESKLNLIGAYIYECSKYDPTSLPVCEWKNELGLSDCPAGMIWSGCASECDDFVTCGGKRPICSSDRRRSACICPQGMINDGKGGCLKSEECIEVAEWSKWYGCSASCGGGQMFRERDCLVEHCEQPLVDTRVCNEQPCIDGQCTCPSGHFSCSAPECSEDQSCELVEGNKGLNAKCVKKRINECKVWGNSHILTFDDAQNNIYGEGSFVFIRRNETANANGTLPWVNVTLETTQSNHAAIVSQISLTFSSKNFNRNISITSKDGHAYLIASRNHTVELFDQDTPSYSVQKYAGQVQYKTWFGLEVIHSDLSVQVRLPSLYQNSTEGLCGDMNFNSTDDYKYKNGTTILYDDEYEYERLEAAYECAKNWTIGGHVGPEPGNFTCENGLEVEEKCLEVLTADWLEDCTAFVDFRKYLNICRVDYCLDSTTLTLTLMVKNLVDECTAENGNTDLKCNWFDNWNSKVECPANSHFTPCGSECDQQFCQTPMECDPAQSSLCVCNIGYVLENGNCIRAKDCSDEESELSEWSRWSYCSDACGGITMRFRYCLGPYPCPDEPLQESTYCDNVEECTLEKCEKNEIWNPCGSECDPTCDEPYPWCNILCVRKCECIPGYVHNKYGRCIPHEECSSEEGEFSEWSKWSNCSDACGGFRHRDRKCLGPQRCPDEPLEETEYCEDIEECTSQHCDDDEIWSPCGTDCEPTCLEPNPLCNEMCVAKCECKKGFIRNHYGKCIPKDQCSGEGGEWSEWSKWSNCSDPCGGIKHRGRYCLGPLSCADGPTQESKYCEDKDSCHGRCDKNEIWNPCGSACEPTCTHRNQTCINVCVPKCVCIEGYIRDQKYRCIKEDCCNINTCGENEYPFGNKCFCFPGFKRDANGVCKKNTDCNTGCNNCVDTDIVNLNYAPVNVNQQNYINVNTEIENTIHIDSEFIHDVIETIEEFFHDE